MRLVALVSFAAVLLAGVYSEEEHSIGVDAAAGRGQAIGGPFNYILNQTRKGVKSYEGDHVLNVEKTAVERILKSLVEKGDIEKWNGNLTHVQIHLPKDKVEETLRILKSQNTPFDVLTDNLQEELSQSKTASASARLRSNRNLGHSMDWTSYHRLADIQGYMDYLAKNFPKIASVGSAGKTVEGRDLKYLKISSGNPNAKRFWIDGGIHAREWAAPASAMYVMKELVENRSKYASIVGNIDFYIMPVMNPDGYEYSHTNERMWRKNRNRHSSGCIGADLNRNWGFNWGTVGISHNPCDPQVYAGHKAFSEPESQALANLILSIKTNLQAYVSFHTYGQYILIPYAFDNVSKPPDFNELRRVAHKAAAAMKTVDGETYQVGHTPTLVGAAAGGSDDWAKGTVGVKYTFTFELRPTVNNRAGFALSSRFIKVVGEEALAGILAIAQEL